MWDSILFHPHFLRCNRTNHWGFVMKLTLALAVSALALTCVSQAHANITEQDVVNAQQQWGEGIVAIGKARINGQDYGAVAAQHINTLYDYQQGDVLFKPTKAKLDQFRETFDEAHSYFVQGIIEEDGGFAINPWVDVRFENHQILIHDDTALAMGNYYFTTGSRQEVKVEYTFGYREDENGDLRIVLHHSSLPYGS